MNEAPNNTKKIPKIISWLFSDRENNFSRIIVVIIPAIITGVISYFASVNTLSNKVDSIKNEIKQELTLVIPPDNLNDDQQLVKGEMIIKSNAGTVDYEKEKWIYYKADFTPDDDGYYCPKSPGFPNWAMWTSQKYKANFEAKIVFSLLDKTNNNKNPTLIFSYGDKANKKPIEYYTINILDGDLNTIRLYPRNGEEIFERSVDDIPLDDYLTFTISPIFGGRSLSSLIIDPTISYLIDGKSKDFTPEKEFKVDLPFISENQGDGFQFGIGVSKGDCFKIISTNL